jgi:hypothetical protein
MSKLKRGLLLFLVFLFLPFSPVQAKEAGFVQLTADLQPTQANGVTQGNQVFLPLVTSQKPTILPESTNILTNESNKFLVSISTDSTQFVFSQTTAEINRVDSGDIIVSGIDANAPNGYLRKVLTKQVVNGQVVLTTAPASLEEAIEQTSVSFNYQFSPDDILETIALPGVTLAGQEITAPNFDMINLQRTELYFGGNLEATGSVILNLSMDFDLEINRFSLERLRMVLQVTETASLQLTSTKGASGGEEKIIGKYRLRPMTIMAGGFPIVVQPTIEVFMGVNGTVSASLTTGFTQTATLSGGVEYVDGDVSPVKDFTKDFVTQPPTLSAQMDLKNGYAPVYLEQYARAVSAKISASCAHDSSSTHSTPVCNPPPVGPIRTVSIPASPSKAASVQNATPPTSPGASSTTAAFSRITGSRAESSRVSNGGRANQTLTLP